MKFYRIKITAWRDRVERQAAAKRNADIGQTEAQLAELQKFVEDERRAKGASAEALKTLEASIAEVAGRRAEIMTAEERQADGVAVAATLHPKVGTEGYQVIVDGLVVRLVDADGNDLPADAAAEYELVQVDAPAPAWADAKRAEWFPKDAAP